MGSGTAESQHRESLGPCPVAELDEARELDLGPGDVLGQTAICLPSCHCNIRPAVRPLPYLIEGVNGSLEATDWEGTIGRIQFYGKGASAPYLPK